MHILGQSSEQGVVERRFDLQVGDGVVPGIVWTPADARGRGPRPLVLMGHGGSLHKRFEGQLRLAHQLVREHGFAAAAIDAPGHGERVTDEHRARMREQYRAGFPLSSAQLYDWLRATIPGAVAEWKATLDALQSLADIGPAPVGYIGFSMGTTLGLPFVAADPRVRAAIFGLAGAGGEGNPFEAAAKQIQVPVRLLAQLHDEVVPAESALALFRALGSQIKTLRVNPGPHVGIPAHEREEFAGFFVRYLQQAQAS